MWRDWVLIQMFMFRNWALISFSKKRKKKKKKKKLGFDLDEQPWGNRSDARKFFDESPLLELVSWNLFFGRLCSGRECG